MRDERTSRCATRNLLKDRSFHFRKARLIKHLTHGAQNRGTFQERVLHTVVHDQIHITLTVSQFGVFKRIKHLTVFLFHDRQRLQALRQHRERLCMHTDLARLGAEHKTFHTNEVTQIQQLLEHYVIQILVLLRADVIPCHIHLHPTFRVLQLHKTGLTHHTAAHHAPSDAHLSKRFFRIALYIQFRILKLSHDVR